MTDIVEVGKHWFLRRLGYRLSKCHINSLFLVCLFNSQILIEYLLSASFGDKEMKKAAACLQAFIV